MNDGLTPLQEVAATLHELFTSLCGAGFTEDQALAIVIAKATVED